MKKRTFWTGSLTTALAGMLIFGAAGLQATSDEGMPSAAVDEALTVSSQAVSGKSEVEVEQAVVISKVSLAGATDTQIAVAPDGTSFATHASVVAGNTYHLELTLENRANRKVLYELMAEAPTTLTIAASPAAEDADGSFAVVPIAPSRWIVSLPQAVDQSTYTVILAVRVAILAPNGTAAFTVTANPVS